jgi:arginine/ornithine N-succinyltransferase beta subunit
MTKADAVRLAEVAQVASDEITRLRAENARLREAMEMARECLEDKDVIGAKQTLTLALGETQ